MKKKNKSYIANHLGISNNVAGEYPVIKAYGNKHVFIENYKNIIEYTDELIKVQSKEYRIEITGSDLNIIFYLEKDMRIDGLIRSILIGWKRFMCSSDGMTKGGENDAYKNIPVVMWILNNTCWGRFSGKIYKSL